MNRKLQADLALVFCTVVWGSTFVVVKGALAHASVFTFLAVRFAVATVAMAPFFRTALRRLTRAEVFAGAVIGFFMFSGYVLQTVGLLSTTPAKGGFITGFSVVLVPIFMALFWRKRLSVWVWAGAVTALVGLYFLSVPPSGFSGLSRGDSLVFCCAILFALHIAFVGHYSPHHSVGALSFLQVATTAVLTIVAVPILAVTRIETPHFEWSAAMAGAIFITALLATAAAFSIQVWAQQYTTATHTAILFTLEPVFAGITSFLVLHERLGTRGGTGAVLILAGILLAELKGAQAAPESPGPVGEPA
jgi:drug/metabolite transporter (DMT)-like permease